ncbi:MAG TPA: AMP-binding protein, partial [Cyclobacteriaceae bacterium]|nr:AMP-binding protein [Cyclobacteriaceae bacterium]
EVGEICLCGPSVAPGYYADKEKTSQAFVSLPTKGEIHRFLRTGDLGIMEKGELFVVGRITDTLLIRGLKYAPEDLEYIIEQSHPALAVLTCTVFSINRNDEEKIVVLQELKKIHDRHDLESIRNSIKDSIYQALGLTVFDIILLPEGSILKTTSGKIKRSDTRIKYMQGKFSEAL